MAGIAPPSPLSDSPLPAQRDRSASRKSASSSAMIDATLSHRPAILDQASSIISSQKNRTYSETPKSPYRAPYPPFIIDPMYSADCASGRGGGSLSTMFPRAVAIVNIPGARLPSVDCTSSSTSGCVACATFDSNPPRPMSIPSVYRPNALSVISAFPLRAPRVEICGL